MLRPERSYDVGQMLQILNLNIQPKFKEITCTIDKSQICDVAAMAANRI
jgi:hypothetical protein